MISIQSFLKSKVGKTLPVKIRKHPVLQATQQIAKIFPYIGLENSSEKLNSKFEEFKNAKICFSSDKNPGAWDISTMSMRGIHSCMKWSSKQSKHLVGSIIDPFTAIIYITDGKKLKYGSKTLRRSVIRYMVYLRKDTKEYRPFIFIERVYKHGAIGAPVDGLYLNHDANEDAIINLFKQYMCKHLNVDLPIWSNKDVNAYHCGMICSKSYSSIKEDEVSYSDAKFKFVNINSINRIIFPPQFLETQL